MTWFLSHMTNHPEIYKKVVKEVDTFFEKHSENELGESDEKLQYSLLLDLWLFLLLILFVSRYLNECINETMRITPAVVGTPVRRLPSPKSLYGYLFPTNVPTLNHSSTQSD